MRLLKVIVCCLAVLLGLAIVVAGRALAPATTIDLLLLLVGVFTFAALLAGCVALGVRWWRAEFRG